MHLVESPLFRWDYEIAEVLWGNKETQNIN